MREYWLFGSSKPLGLGLFKALSADHKVVCFSRSVPADVPDTLRVDFSDIAATRAVIKKSISATAPDGAVFCQRYRPVPGQSDLEAVKAGLDVELAPVLTLIEETRARKSTRPLSIVLISSVAGQNAHVDIPLYYHLLKSATLMATKSLATAHAADNIRVNCIVLGEFEKYARVGYTDREKAKFDMLETFTLSSRLCGIGDIAGTAAFLLSDQAAYITGQTINLDGNLSNISQESIIRAIAAKQGG